jgi:pantothenate kinase
LTPASDATPEHPAAIIAATLAERARDGARHVVAIAGPPGSGKSTIAAEVVRRLADAGRVAALVEMDGFHYDNAVLGPDILPRKGAPETFDVAGLLATLARIRADDGAVAIPVFDRDLDLARAGARLVEPAHRIVVVEGNYLLLDEAPWRGLAGFFDETVLLEVPEAELRRRLLARWLHHGLERTAALARAEGNDLVNARRVVIGSRTPDRIISTGE